MNPTTLDPAEWTRTLVKHTQDAQRALLHVTQAFADETDRQTADTLRELGRLRDEAIAARRQGLAAFTEISQRCMESTLAAWKLS